MYILDHLKLQLSDDVACKLTTLQVIAVYELMHTNVLYLFHAGR